MCVLICQCLLPDQSVQFCAPVWDLREALWWTLAGVRMVVKIPFLIEWRGKNEEGEKHLTSPPTTARAQESVILGSLNLRGKYVCVCVCGKTLVVVVTGVWTLSPGPRSVPGTQSSFQL